MAGTRAWHACPLGRGAIRILTAAGFAVAGWLLSMLLAGTAYGAEAIDTPDPGTGTTPSETAATGTQDGDDGRPVRHVTPSTQPTTGETATQERDAGPGNPGDTLSTHETSTPEPTTSEPTTSEPSAPEPSTPEPITEPATLEPSAEPSAERGTETQSSVITLRPDASSTPPQEAGLLRGLLGGAVHGFAGTLEGVTGAVGNISDALPPLAWDGPQIEVPVPDLDPVLPSSPPAKPELPSTQPEHAPMPAPRGEPEQSPATLPAAQTTPVPASPPTGTSALSTAPGNSTAKPDPAPRPASEIADDAAAIGGGAASGSGVPTPYSPAAPAAPSCALTHPHDGSNNSRHLVGITNSPSAAEQLRLVGRSKISNSPGGGRHAERPLIAPD